jgi:hypothetical protein
MLACAVLCSLGLAALAGAAPALASHNETVYFEAHELLNAKARPKALSEMKWLGVKALRVELFWREVAPRANSRRRPKFNQASPSAYHWGQYDALLSTAAALHWKVLLTVTAPGPKWAMSGHRDYVTRPSDSDFEQFMEAVGRHFGKEVSMYAIWNEPNHPDYLKPQYRGHTPVSPGIYRSLFLSGYNGLKKAGVSNPKVLMGETAPTGDARVVSPLAFLRGALCLNSHYHKVGRCGELPAYGYAHHAYTTAAGPFYRPPNKDDVMIAVLSRLTNALNLASRAGAIKPNMEVFLTEFGIQSKPNRYLGVPVAQQAEYDAIAERIAYENPRVVAFSQYLLRDDKLGGRPGSAVIGFQTGLEYVNGKRKPLFYGWPVQLAVAKLSHGYSLWGHVRPTEEATTATVLIQRPGARSYTTLKTVRTNSEGYWTLNSSVAGEHWRVQWTSPTGVKHLGPPIRAYKTP